jgi:metallophosphoesterase (TIGR00282 family)
MLFQELEGWRGSQWPDLVVVNGENAAGGNGITHEILDELLAAGVDVITSGNHIFDKREVFSFIGDVPRLLRPVNLPPETPGAGWIITSGRNGVPCAVVNLAGRAFMPVQYDDPLRAIDQLLPRLHGVPVILVDFHAETTSEKVALGWYLNGRVTAVVGTHTHVQTADEWVLPGGTAYITDLGMTGPRDSVIGVKTELVLQKMKTQLPTRFEAASGAGQFCAVLIEADPTTGRATGIRRILKREP